MTIPEWLVRYTNRVHLTKVSMERVALLSRDMKLTGDQIIDAAIRIVNERDIADVIARDVEDTARWRKKR